MSQEQDEYLFSLFFYEKIVCKEGKGPPIRYNPQIAVNAANFYSFGYDPTEIEDDAEKFQDLWRFNFSTKTWCRYRNSKTLPREHVLTAMLLQGNLLMVFGGASSPIIYYHTDLYVCNVNQDNGVMKEIKIEDQHPLQLYKHAVVHHNHSIYTCGETVAFSDNCDIHRLDLKTLEWSGVYVNDGFTNEGEPRGRFQHRMAFDGENIFILGGCNIDMVYGLDVLPCFNIKKNQWRNVTTVGDDIYGFPAPRHLHQVVQITVNDRIQAFIIGGNDDDNIFGDLWRLDLSTLKWTSFPHCTLPKEINRFATAVTLDGRLCIFGDIFYELNDDEEDNAEERPYETTHCIYSAWLRIPNLSEICWEALLSRFPLLVSHDPQSLISIGIPTKFVQRLS